MEVLQVIPDRDVPRSELKVLTALRRADDLEGVALHSIAWQGVRVDRQADGEADIVLLHPQRGILILEVKGGGIDVTDGKWFSTDGSGQRHDIKNPFEQAKSSKHALLRYLKVTEPEIARKVDVAHAVVFPDVTCDFSWLAPDSPRSIVIDRADLADISSAVQRVFAHWGCRRGPNTAERNRLRALLAPTLTVRRQLRDIVSDAEAELLQLTQGQVQAMQSLRRNRRLVILGGAGTGKTILAVERARQLAAAGSRVLLLCFNRPLGDHLRGALARGGVDVETFHSLCSRVFEQGKFSYPPLQDASWWDGQAATCLVDLCGRHDIQYDAVLVDESQDFREDWLDALECLLSSREDSVFVLYGDPHQSLWHRGWDRWLTRHHWPHYELLTNCRNALPIAKTVASVFGDAPQSLGVHGPDPVFHQLDTRREGIAPVVALIERAIDEEGLQPDQIAVLTSSKELAQRFEESMAWDHQFAPVGKAKTITADTIHRFKGLEAAFVIVVFGPEVGTGEDERFQELKYVAYSRPTAVLHVFAPKSFKR